MESNHAETDSGSPPRVGAHRDFDTWEGSVSAIFGGALSLMGILVAVMIILMSEIKRIDPNGLSPLLTQGLESIMHGSVAVFVICGWCAFCSAMFLNHSVFWSVVVHRRLIFWPMMGMLVLVTLGVGYWALR